MKDQKREKDKGRGNTQTVGTFQCRSQGHIDHQSSYVTPLPLPSWWRGETKGGEDRGATRSASLLLWGTLLNCVFITNAIGSDKQRDLWKNIAVLTFLIPDPFPCRYPKQRVSHCLHRFIIFASQTIKASTKLRSLHQLPSVTCLSHINTPWR